MEKYTYRKFILFIKLLEIRQNLITFIRYDKYILKETPPLKMTDNCQLLYTEIAAVILSFP